ncbi:hypothetical protein [Desulfuribacillus stibiiarsenatis]|uniref:hypothetical protein n=1 Tax=Desulfuribacillus stibiiarsenatis TaxID=1390249 RepID=UPI00114CA1D2|nr:hypothetical protein [Desulfuribacillus stibiiarsenatis]
MPYLVLGDIDTLLSVGIIKVSTESGVYYDEIRYYAESLGQLKIDLFLIIINPENKKFEIVIGEVKDISSLGLKEYSQLIGYCLSSYSGYGLLINVNGGASKNLTDLLALDEDLSIVRRLTQAGELIEHQFGVFKWNSKNSQAESLQLGRIYSLPAMIIELCDKIKTGT